MMILSEDDRIILRLQARSFNLKMQALAQLAKHKKKKKKKIKGRRGK